jgi:outer membrane receptor for ferrienterochelin and colicin
MNTSLNWTRGDFTLGLRHRWADGTTLDEVQFGANPATRAVPELDGYSYLDISFNYDATEELSIWGGLINALDQDPPLLGSRQTRANTSPDTFSPIGTELFIGGAYRF